MRINGGANVTITGSLTDGSFISVFGSAGGTAAITLDNVSISGLNNTTLSPLGVNGGATPGTPTNLTITLVGNNLLDSTASPPSVGGFGGINMADNATLTINGTGTLTAKGGVGAGIGGSAGSNRSIIIESGTINATGGYNDGSSSALPVVSGAAGIGGSNGAPAGNITIHGGTVTATGGPGAAGIGGGCSDLVANGGTILIDGGTVIANGMTGNSDSGVGGAGIGGGCGGYVDSIAIQGTANVTATGGAGAEITTGAHTGEAGGGGAGIGAGGSNGNSSTGIPAGSVTIASPATVTATGGAGALADPAGPTPGMHSGSGAGIGGGGGGSSSTTQTPVTLDTSTWPSTVTATGGPGATSIGAGGVATEPAPTATIDYPNQSLTGLTPNAWYEIKSDDGTSTIVQADGSGTVNIPDSMTGHNVTVTKQDPSDHTRTISQPETLTLPAKPAAGPSGIGHTDETAAGKHDGTLTGIDNATMECRVNGGAWGACNTTGLAPGTYEVRLKGTTAPPPAKFPSASTTVVVKTAAATITTPGTNPLTPGTSSDLTLSIPLPSPYDGSGTVTVQLPPGATINPSPALPAGCTVTPARDSFTCPINNLPHSGGKATLPFKVDADTTVTSKDITVTISGLNGGNNGTYVIPPIPLAPTGAATAVPTLNEWALALLALTLAGAAGLRRNRRG